MVVSKMDVGAERITRDDANLEALLHFQYLGSWINQSMDPDEEIKARIETARMAFPKLKPLLCAKQLNINLRERLIKYDLFCCTLAKHDRFTKRIIDCQMEYFGHVIRGPRYSLLRFILSGKIEGTGRKKLSWFRNL